MNDLHRLNEAYSSFKASDFTSALKLYRSLLDGGRCDPMALNFFINLCNKELITVSQRQTVQSLSSEIKRINESGMFDDEFYHNVYGHSISPGMSAVEDFCVHGWQARRDPNPFFSVARYLSKVDSTDLKGGAVNPLIDYLNSRFDLAKVMNAGIFDFFEYLNHHSTSLCFPSEIQFSPIHSNSPKILVVVHAFYTKRLKNLLASLRNIPYCFELVVTVCRHGDVEIVESIFLEEGLSVDSFDIKVFPNQGRDMLPFAKIIREMNAQKKDFNFVLKLHTKQSHTVDKGSAYGDLWLESMLSNLLGSPFNVKYIITELFQRKGCALVSPLTPLDVFRFCKWRNNLSPIAHLKDIYAVNDLPEDSIYFPAGSMFWIDFDQAIKICSCFEDERVPPEPLPKNGTYLHGYERLIPYILESSQRRMQSHCNLDANGINPINFSLLLPSATFDQWMRNFTSLSLFSMMENHASLVWYFPVYKTPAVCFVVVSGKQPEPVISTLISLYFLRSWLEFEVILDCSLLTSEEVELISNHFMGIQFRRNSNRRDHIQYLCDCISDAASQDTMLLTAGSFITPMQFKRMISDLSQDSESIYMLHSNQNNPPDNDLTVYYSKTMVLLECLSRPELNENKVDDEQWSQLLFQLIHEHPSMVAGQKVVW